MTTGLINVCAAIKPLLNCLGRRLVVAAGLVLCALSMRSAMADQPTINVATYNLRLNIASDGANAWPNRKDAVKALIQYHELDIVGTQEGLIDQIEDLATMDGFAYVGVGRDDGKRAGEFAAIFYKKARFTVMEHGDYWLSETPDRPGKGWDARCCNRIASWAKMRDRRSGKLFYVFSVHFDHEGVVARRESAHLMLRKMRELAGNHPLLCLGDFNSTPDSEPISIMSAGLRDAYRVSETAPYGPVGTFNDFKLEAELKNRIDYIFVNSPVKVIRYGALTDSIGARFPSDHLPVVARVAFH